MDYVNKVFILMCKLNKAVNQLNAHLKYLIMIILTTVMVLENLLLNVLSQLLSKLQTGKLIKVVYSQIVQPK